MNANKYSKIIPVFLQLGIKIKTMMQLPSF